MRGKNRAVVEAAATEANVRSRVVTFAEGTDDVGEADAEKPSKERAGQPEPVSQAPSQHNTRSIHTVTHCCLLLSCSLGIKSGARVHRHARRTKTQQELLQCFWTSQL